MKIAEDEYTFVSIFPPLHLHSSLQNECKNFISRFYKTAVKINSCFKLLGKIVGFVNSIRHVFRNKMILIRWWSLLWKMVDNKSRSIQVLIFDRVHTRAVFVTRTLSSWARRRREKTKGTELLVFGQHASCSCS